jgi:hypothetical protein
VSAKHHKLESQDLRRNKSNLLVTMLISTSIKFTSVTFWSASVDLETSRQNISQQLDLILCFCLVSTHVSRFESLISSKCIAAEPMARGYCRNNQQHLAHRGAAVLVKLEMCFSHVCPNLWYFGQCLSCRSLSEAQGSPDYIWQGT